MSINSKLLEKIRWNSFQSVCMSYNWWLKSLNNKRDAKQDMLLYLFFVLDVKFADCKVLEGLDILVKNFLTKLETKKKNHGYRDLEYGNLGHKIFQPRKKDLK